MIVASFSDSMANCVALAGSLAQRQSTQARALVDDSNERPRDSKLKIGWGEILRGKNLWKRGDHVLQVISLEIAFAQRQCTQAQRARGRQ